MAKIEWGAFNSCERERMREVPEDMPCSCSPAKKSAFKFMSRNKLKKELLVKLNGVAWKKVRNQVVVKTRN